MLDRYRVYYIFNVFMEIKWAWICIPERQHNALTTFSIAGDFTLLICPGIANSSESLYICTCVDNAQNHGYRVAVLNHLGALREVRLTAPRIFTYGKVQGCYN